MTNKPNAHDALFQCPVCGEMNTKRRSFAGVGSQRVCRTHPQVKNVKEFCGAAMRLKLLAETSRAPYALRDLIE